MLAPGHADNVHPAASRQLDSFLIFVGASGLFLMFTMYDVLSINISSLMSESLYRLFFELCGKNVFLGRVWFELLWTGLFFVMELGALIPYSVVISKHG